MVEMCKFSFKMTGQLAVPPEGQTKIKIIVIIIKKRKKEKCSQERVHRWGIWEAQKSLGGFFDAGSDEDAVWGLADGVGDWLICKLRIKVSQVTGATLWKGKKMKHTTFRPKRFVSAQFKSKWGQAPLCRDSQCYHLGPTVLTAFDSFRFFFWTLLHIVSLKTRWFSSNTLPSN